MALPRPPRTNAYKFLVTFGLILVVAGVVVPRQYQDEIEVAHDVVLSAAGESASATETWFEAFVSSGRRGHPTDEDVERLREESIAAQVAQTMASEEFDRTLSDYRDLVSLSVVGGLVGVAIMLVGLMLWFRRLHRWQEAIIGHYSVIPEKPSTRDEMFH